MVVAVKHDDRLLLVRQAYGPYQHEWDLVAGFVEPGETLEGATIQELWEETDLVSANLTYGGSHPWSFSGPSVLLIDLAATVTAPALELDTGEITEARWFSRAELRDLDPAEMPSFPYTRSLI